MAPPKGTTAIPSSDYTTEKNHDNDLSQKNGTEILIENHERMGQMMKDLLK
jgi:hypothetical protein